MKGLSLQNLEKSFNHKRAVEGVSFDVLPGEIVAVLGPSGCGKSTLLNLIAGLEAADSGDVLWDGESLKNVPPHQRGFGLMFQDFALFPHRNVFENVAFGLRMAHLPKDQVEKRVAEVLELVGLPGFNPRDVNTLSGGEQQRVALARSLAPNPRLLMLDEPLGSLDRNLRERLVVDLRHVLEKSHQTAIYVTHDQEEAFVLADRVVVMNAGKVIQVGTPQEIYLDPASAFVARFLGMDNLFPGEIRFDGNETRLETPLGVFPMYADAGSGAVTVLLRADAVHLDAGGDCQFSAQVTSRSFRGNVWLLSVMENGISLDFEIPANQALPEPGETVCLSFSPTQALQVFPKSVSSAR
jgi:ABC-type Fe3+/spermidine/putrescine transport system ATPase subunit